MKFQQRKEEGELGRKGAITRPKEDMPTKTNTKPEKLENKMTMMSGKNIKIKKFLSGKLAVERTIFSI